MADQKLPVAVAATVAILGAIAGVLQFLPATTTQIIDVVNRPKASFDDGMQQLETGLKSPQPSVLVVRTTAAEAYRRAGQAWFGRATDWKCQVVDLFYNEMDPILSEAMPLAAYSDYEAAKLTPCDAHVFTVATLDWNTFLTLKAQSDGSTQRLEAIRHVVAQGTKAQVVGWAYLGELDSKGRYTIKYIHEPAANVGDTVTTASEATADGVMLHLFPPAPDDKASRTSIGGIAGFLPDGSKMTILKLGRLPEHRIGEADGYLAFAEARVVSVEPLLASASHRRHRFLQLAERVRGDVALAASPATCPVYQQHNSVHGQGQLWVFAGETDNSNANAFLAGTSRLNTSCIPRDGQVVRAARDMRVFIGPDPHWPGVRPQGGVVAAGIDIRVAGDVAGYPFDATANPNFCSAIPVPQQSLVPIPPGHQKRYCVYLPFSPA
jgi:hypothetical protein